MDYRSKFLFIEGLFMRLLPRHARAIEHLVPEEMKSHPGWDDFIFWGGEKRKIECIGHTGEQDSDQPLQKIFSSRDHIFTKDFFKELDTGRAITLKRFLREIELARRGEQGLFKKEESEVWDTVLIKGVSCFWLASVHWFKEPRMQIWEMFAGNIEHIYIDKKAVDVYGV